ncbi:glycosyltransferase family 2 protein, partial [Clostridium tarantellae]
MGNKDLICSVIIPVYNVEKYLRRCIDSIINQSEKNIEIILVNDGSTDGSRYICNEYEKKDKRIKLIHKKNGGLSDARNVGLNASSGKYLLFVDSDDWCDLHMISDMCNKAEENNADLVVCGYLINYSDEKIIRKEFIEEKLFAGKNEIKEGIFEIETKAMFNVVWNKLYKNKIIKKINLIFDKEGVPGEDLIFNCEYLKNINKLFLITGCYYNYMRLDIETLVYKYRKNLYEMVNKFNNSRKELYTFYNMHTGKYKVLLSNTYISYIFSCIPNIYRENANISNKKRKEFFEEILKNTNVKEAIKVCEPSNIQLKLFKKLYQINSAKVMLFSYSILFKLRYKLS